MISTGTLSSSQQRCEEDRDAPAGVVEDAELVRPPVRVPNHRDQRAVDERDVAEGEDEHRDDARALAGGADPDGRDQAGELLLVCRVSLERESQAHR